MSGDEIRAWETSTIEFGLGYILVLVGQVGLMVLPTSKKLKIIDNQHIPPNIFILLIGHYIFTWLIYRPISVQNEERENELTISFPFKI